MKLPASVKEIADVIGVERALFLVGQLPRCYVRDQRYPGARSAYINLYVPTLQRMKPNHELVRLLGWECAEKLARHFGGELFKLATCDGIYRDFRDGHISRLVVEGVPVQMVAGWFGVSDRHVKNVARENPAQELKATNDNTAPVINQRRNTITNGLPRHRKIS